MIKYKDTIFPDFFIDPETAVITNSKGEIQKIKIKDGRPYFKSMDIHRIQVHTNLGYKKDYDIHHIDENKMNNSLSNLVYLTKSEHSKIHKKIGRTFSEETKQKLSEALKGRTFSEETKQKLSEALKGRTLSEETKQKMSKSHKGLNKDRIWINNGVENRYISLDDEIPEGFVRGRLKNK